MTATPNTPDTVNELLDRQCTESGLTDVQKVLVILAEMSPKDNHEVVETVVEVLRDWHKSRAKELMEEGEGAALSWAAEATLLQVALSNLKSVTY